MKYFLSLFLVCIVSATVQGQNPQTMLPRDTLLDLYDVDFDPYDIRNEKRSVGDDPNMFRRIINNQFSSLITGESKNVVGNFASVDLTAPSVSFAGSIISKNGSVFSVKANGAVSDGFFSVFNNSKLNTQVSLDLQYNFLNLRKLVLAYNADSARAFNKKVAKIKFDWEETFMTLFHQREYKLLEQKEQNVTKERDSLKTALILTLQSNTVEVERLQYEIEKKQHLLDSVQQAITGYTLYSTLFRNAHNRVVQDLDKLSFQSAVEGFSFGWFSFGYKVNNNKFKIFDPAASFASQITEHSFVSHQAKAQYSWYTWTPQAFGSTFFDIGANFTYSDNFNDLKKKEVNEVTNYGPTTDERTVGNKYNAYQGVYKKNLKGLTFYSDFYWFLFQDNIGAVHINPSWVTADHSKPIANMYVGFLLSFKNAKTEGAVVNTELYYQFLDVFKATDTEYRLFERNNVGIRFTFPIQFK